MSQLSEQNQAAIQRCAEQQGYRLFLYAPLDSFPNDVLELTHLQGLHLSGVGLNHLPAEIVRLVNLRDLSLSLNNLAHLPPEIGQLRHLEDLQVYDNILEALPPELGQLPKLWRIGASRNYLTRIPPELGKLRNLWRLDLSQNDLTHLPDELGQLRNLVTLDLAHNQLTELPATLKNLTRLEVLILDGNANLRSLPAGIRADHISLRDCTGLTTLPADLIARSVDIGGTQIVADRDLFEVDRWFWNDVRIPKKTPITEPDKLTGKRILKERNVELRRAMIERIGVERFISAVDAREIDRDTDAGGDRRLLMIDMHDDEPLVVLNVLDPSTGRGYMLRVPPHIQTCRAAAAWVAGFDDPDDYNPLIET